LNPIYGGNVAIGGTTAEQKLHVHGNAKINGNLYGDIWRIVKDSTYDGTFIQSANYNGTNDLGNIYITARNGNDLTRFQVWAQDSLFKGNITATKFIGDLQGNADSATKATQDDSGNVITSTYLPKSGGTVNGDITVTGNVSAQNVIINGKTISYNASENALVLPMNLLVEGGIAWNSKIDGFDAPTITDAVSVDGISIIRDGGVLRVSPDYIQSVGGLDENELHNYLTVKNYAKKSDIPSLSGYATESFVVSQGYITQPTLVDTLMPYAKTADVNSLLTEYLPKSGGTVRGNFAIRRDPAVIAYYKNADTKLGYMGINSELTPVIYNAAGNTFYRILTEQNYSRFISGYATTSSLANYLPKSGGTVNGNIEATGNISAQNVTATNALITGGTAYASALKSKSICIECDENGAYDSKYDGDINRFGGALWIQASSGNDLYLGGTYANTTIRSTLEVNKAATFKETLTATTQMMIGSYDAPSQALEVRGNILATGEVSWNSSRVLKDIVGDAPTYLTLAELMAIKPYRYTWKDGRDKKVHAGGIADEVLEILPEVVITDVKNIHSMDYGQAAFTMAASLTPYVGDHERRIKDLEAENNALKQEIEKLKRAS
jgi:hypothetical protein